MTNNEQQTAVDSVIEYFSQYVDMKKHIEEIQQFKEMEKERMIEFHIEVMKDGLLDEGESVWTDAYLPKISGIANQYYEKTYGGNK